MLQGPGDPVGLRRVAICDRAADDRGARRREGAGVDRLPEGLREERRGQALPLRLWRVRDRHPAGVQLQPDQPARPRLGLRDRPYPRRRRPRPPMVPRRQARQADQHVQRFRRCREGAGRGELHEARPDRDQRRFGRRRADGRGGQFRPRAVGRGGRRRAVRRRAQHDARRHAAADPGRMARMGQSDHRQGRVRPDPQLQPLRQCAGRRTIRRC